MTPDELRALAERLREPIPWERTTRGDRPTYQLWENHCEGVDRQRWDAAVALTAAAQEIETLRGERDQYWNVITGDLMPCIAALNERAEAAERLVAELEQDAARLDWMTKQGDDTDITICPPGNHGGPSDKWLVDVDKMRGPVCEYFGLTLRAAIDAAMKEGA